MIHRKFDSLKFKRTYIGGSKQSELKIFADVQGTKEDNSEVNWLEYRRILTQYLNDVLNIILSWKYLVNILSFVTITLAILTSFMNPHISVFFLLTVIGFRLAFQYFVKKERKMLSAYDFSLDVVLSEINKETGFNLSKN